MKKTYKYQEAHDGNKALRLLSKLTPSTADVNVYGILLALDNREEALMVPISVWSAETFLY